MILKHLQKGFLEFVYGFYRGIRTHDIVMAYEGEMNHQLMMDFTGITLGNMSGEKEGHQVRKRVYHVMVECIQNISRHAYLSRGKEEEGLNHGLLIVSKNPDDYLITTGNLVDLDRAPQLSGLLEKINFMNRTELDELYRDQLRNGNLSEKGGAGLGLIDIRRKTGQKLEFHFLPADREHSFFLLTTRVVRNS